MTIKQLEKELEKFDKKTADDLLKKFKALVREKAAEIKAAQKIEEIVKAMIEYRKKRGDAPATPEEIEKAKDYLKKMRKNAHNAPSLEEITEIVEEVRAERYAKNSN